MCPQAARTVLAGDGVGHVDLAVGRFSPHAAAGSAGVSVPLHLVVIGDVVHHVGLVLSAD